MLSRVEHEKSFISSRPCRKPWRQIFSQWGSYVVNLFLKLLATQNQKVWQYVYECCDQNVDL